MTRVILVQTFFFLLPFVLFAAFLVMRQRNPMLAAAWDGTVPWLVLAGLACTIAAFLISTLLVQPSTGVYVPPHMENGRLVPGQFR